MLEILIGVLGRDPLIGERSRRVLAVLGSHELLEQFLCVQVVLLR